MKENEPIYYLLFKTYTEEWRLNTNNGKIEEYTREELIEHIKQSVRPPEDYKIVQHLPHRTVTSIDF
jgi:hypothetical protein